MILKVDETDQFYDRVIQTLRKGDIVALPTDTVYGFAADGSQLDTVKRLGNIKRRGDKPFTLFISRNRIEEYVTIVKRKIIEYFVPGPLTIILRKRKEVSLPLIEDKIGIRIPQVDFVIKLLNLYNKPLAVTSANLSGKDTLNSAYEIAEGFPDVKLVIDGGHIFSKPSTVLDLTETPPLVIRKGSIPILEIEKVYGRSVHLSRLLKFNILFVCTGNTCRSPMAEGIFGTLVDKKYCDVKSAGVLQMNGVPPAQNAQEIVKEYGGSITHKLSQTVTRELIDWADLILVMEYRHYIYILEISQKATMKTFLLKEYKKKVKYNEISDPVGKDIVAYREAAQDMLSSLRLIARDVKRRFMTY